MSRIVVVALLAGCTADPRAHEVSIGVAELSAATLDVEVFPGELRALIELPPHGACPILAPSVAVTLDGVPATVDPGRAYVSSSANPAAQPTLEACDPPVIHALATAASQSTLRLADASGEARVTIIAPFAPRAITVDGGGLVAGTPAVLRLSPPSDTIAPPPLPLWNNTPAMAMTLFCFAQDVGYDESITATTAPPPDQPSWALLAVDGSTLSFTTPAVSFHSQYLDCQWSWVRSAALAECTGVAACSSRVELVGTDSFYTTI